ncbi:hypothetical protein MNBD_GAMMA20-1280 [hydrothermal vent metagenome]|uniref:Methyltransferase domain-containing protein n=1 Tax=hydrothermal vent metagenome TaxID=652676 RepID=A0A3B0ZYE5_9ZZZZ
MSGLDTQARKQRVISVFDEVASGYDNPALRFFPFSAERALGHLNPKPGSKILDAATGTGALAMALAQAVGPQGRVIGIDLSTAMLERATHNAAKMALNNIDLLEMDAEAPDFRSNYFDAVTCGFGLFFLPDMLAALKQWRRITRPGGTVLFTSFTAEAFAPLAEHFFTTLESFGLDFSGDQQLASQRLVEADSCRGLMEEAGFEAIEQYTDQLGYPLHSPNDWWEVVWNSGLRGIVQRLPAGQQEEFQRAHLAQLDSLQTEKGLWMGVEVRITLGRVP